jgi:flagellar hook-associated protein 1 FlgK
MTSTFSGLTSAYSGLVAARQGLAVTGENITNASTPGYSREVETTSANSPVSESMFTTGAQVGNGVSINGVTRVDSSLLDAQVRTTAASSGYATEQSTAMDSIESALNEPGANGLSTTLQSFWSAWQNVSTQSTSEASATTVIAAGQQVASQLADGYTATSNQWASTRSNVDSTVTSINTAASQIAELNGQIRSTLAAGGNAGALQDQQNTLAVTVAGLSGATVRSNADGTMDVLLGGNALVSGTTANAIAASGSATMAGAGSSPVQVNFVDNPAATVSISSGTLGADLSLLGPSGALMQAAQSYDDVAASVASSVNGIFKNGYTASGTTNLSFFSGTTALTLAVVPTNASGIASAAQGTGAANGDVANQISQLTSSTSGPDSKWAAFVVSVGVSAQAATSQATITATGSATAVNNQLSESSVDTDQETTNMLTFQNAFDAAARVMTTVDAMLDTLINKTGMVGIN